MMLTFPSIFVQVLMSLAKQPAKQYAEQLRKNCHHIFEHGTGPIAFLVLCQETPV